MALLYIFGGILSFIAAWMLVNRLSLRRLRVRRKKEGYGRDQFLEAFRDLAVPVEIPAVVYDYYASLPAWRNFPFSPDDEYSKVLRDEPLDLHEDERILISRLGMMFPPEYILREWPGQPTRTLRDMVIWLDWVRQHQNKC